MQQPAEGHADRIAAVIVTYHRLETLCATLSGLASQTHAPCWVVVVDNAAEHAVRDRLATEFPGVTYIPVDDNPGYGAGLSVGMREAKSRYEPDWYWLLDDDSPPHPDHLESLLDVARVDAGSWVIAGRGGKLGLQLIHLAEETTSVQRVDFALVDGALVSRNAVEAVGYPREDLFMMFEDVEYSTRVRMAGGGIALAPGIVDQSQHLGSHGVWRSYYQARNHLRSAIDLRSFALFRTWVVRILIFTASDLSRRRFQQLRLRWAGVRDAARNRMGKTVDPR